MGHGKRDGVVFVGLPTVLKFVETPSLSCERFPCMNLERSCDICVVDECKVFRIFFFSRPLERCFYQVVTYVIFLFKIASLRVYVPFLKKLFYPLLNISVGPFSSGCRAHHSICST